jgi:hypothetical protein
VEPTAVRVTSPVFVPEVVPEIFDAEIDPVNVLFPAIVWVVVDISPGDVPSAVCMTRLLPDMTAPSEDLV